MIRILLFSDAIQLQKFCIIFAFWGILEFLKAESISSKLSVASKSFILKGSPTEIFGLGNHVNYIFPISDGPGTKIATESHGFYRSMTKYCSKGLISCLHHSTNFLPFLGKQDRNPEFEFFLILSITRAQILYQN